MSDVKIPLEQKISEMLESYVGQPNVEQTRTFIQRDLGNILVEYGYALDPHDPLTITIYDSTDVLPPSTLSNIQSWRKPSKYS